MADRATASIVIGGHIPRSCISGLIAAVELDGGRADWQGEALDDTSVRNDEVLEAFACELPGGIFQETESFCEQHGIAFVRGSGSCAGAFGPERAVFTGKGPAAYFDLTESDEVVLTRSGLRALGSLEAIETWFASAEFTPPPVTIVEGEGASAQACELCHG
ncbi:hypothetical protein NT2_06_02260 [Caenibius tardaugens NBRC 16725]|uniref:Uncharacterized protein n=1 Tax=Caenibius tardaugens NBRC 16725 TaxID=1219035 RepID=U2Y930_9SPHN|nr:hypothetical protein [Caenibius tardaugens]AZI37673.1 hypothetical protein EGO55_18260 [Caenibius tardaugens NBRC 16725]GAD49786.1 hypothetical protein NT2_06_02260 [Caenibius tardaugens NBRC 16725]